MGQHSFDGHETTALHTLFKSVQELTASADVHALFPDSTPNPGDHRVERIVRASLPVGDHEWTVPRYRVLELNQSSSAYKAPCVNRTHHPV